MGEVAEASRARADRTWWWLIAAITLLGAVPRIIGSTESLAWDELYLYEWVHGHGFAAMMDVVQAKEKTPPLGFIAAWVVDGFNGPPQTLRIPQVIAGVAIVPMAALVARRVFSPVAGTVSALLAAASPMLVFYSSEARSYSMTTALALASTLLLLRLLDTGSRKAAVAYSLAAAAALMSHYTAVSVLAVQALVAFALWPERRRLVAASQIGPVLATLAWLPGLIDQVRISSEELQRIAVIAPLSFSTVVDVIGRSVLGHPGHPLGPDGRVPGPTASALIASGAAIALGFALFQLATAIRERRLHAPRRAVALLIAISAAAPLLAVAVSSQPGQSMLFARNLMVSAPCSLVLLAGLIMRSPRLTAVISTGLITAGMAIGDVTALTTASRPPARSAALEVANRWQPGDRIVEICCRAGGRGPLGTAVAINLPARMKPSLSTTTRTGYLPFLLPMPKGGSIFVIAYEPHQQDGPELPGSRLDRTDLVSWVRPLEFEPPAQWSEEFEPVAGGRIEGLLDTVWAQYRRRDESPSR